LQTLVFFKSWFSINEKDIYVLVGAIVIISARRVDRLKYIAESCEDVSAKFKSGGSIVAIPLDVTDYEAQKLAVVEILKLYGRIDSLVLNAGRSQRNLAIETDLEVTSEIMNLNFFSYISLVKQVLPHMIERKQGQVYIICNIFTFIIIVSLLHTSDSHYELLGWYYRNTDFIILFCI
jgi:NADP-dependent 3-hydroxy acid dehydrogenase YdfG